MTNDYDVTIRLLDRLIGGIPILPEEDRAPAYEKWLARRIDSPTDCHELAEALAVDEDMPVVPDEEPAETLNGFRHDSANGGGLYIEARQVKAMLREAAQRLGLIKTKRGVRQVLQHDLIVRSPHGGQKLGLGVSEPAGIDQRPISVVTAQGPRSALKRSEYVVQPELRFVIRVLVGGIGDGLIGEAELREMLLFAGEFLGLGADRSQGEGTFELVSLSKVDATVPA